MADANAFLFSSFPFFSPPSGSLVTSCKLLIERRQRRSLRSYLGPEDNGALSIIRHLAGWLAGWLASFCIQSSRDLSPLIPFPSTDQLDHRPVVEVSAFYCSLNSELWRDKGEKKRKEREGKKKRMKMLTSFTRSCGFVMGLNGWRSFSMDIGR